VHTREDEYSIVTEGQIGFRSGDREVVLGTGGYITKPRGELHAMWNAGKVPARMIEIISPAGFEGFFRELADLAEAGQPPFDQIAALAASYGLEFGDAEWLPDVIAPLRAEPADTLTSIRRRPAGGRCGGRRPRRRLARAGRPCPPPR
jgi:hypothetical protein